MSAGESSAGDPSQPLSPEAEKRVVEIVEQFLGQLQAGEVIDRPALENQFPDLAPVLGRRLQFVERVFLAARQSPPASDQYASAPVAGDHGSSEATTSLPRSSPSRDLSREHAQHLRCPHCGNPIQLVQVAIADVTCRVCGSTVHVDPSATLTYAKAKHPTKIGRFEILEVLGRGAFGIVYKAHDTELRRTVAVKVPRAGYFVTDEERERFLREARNAARLRHPQIVQVHQVAHDGSVPCIVCDFIDGVTLDDLMSGRRLSYRETAELAAQVGDALDYAHREHVIHRDVKPSNILIDAARRPVITDFGLARRDDGEITITLDGEVLGTPAYMSPEQAEGNYAKVDGRTDVYSLGVVLYRMLAGELPFRGSKRMTLYQVVHDDPRPPRSLNDTVPRDLDTIALKAMAKEPDQRYATAREMSADLRRWLNGEPILARPTSTAERLVRWCRRHRAIAALAGALAFVLVALAVVFGVSAWREHRLRVVAQQAQQQEAVERKRANENANTSRQRLVNLQVAEGVRHLDESDYIAALVWFVNAAELDRDDSARSSIHRLRIGAVLAQSPKLSHLWPQKGRVVHAEWSDDGGRIMSASDDGTVEVLDATTGQRLASVLHGGNIVTAAISRDGRRIVSSSWDKTVFLWNVATPSEIIPLAHAEIVKAAAFSPDGKLVATACYDKRVRLWDATTGAAIAESDEHESGVIGVAFSPDGSRLASTTGVDHGSAGAARLWDVPTLAAHGQPIAHDKPSTIYRAVFSPSGAQLLTCGREGTARVWNAESLEAITPPLVHAAGVVDGAFTPDGKFVVTASGDGTARVWNAVTGASQGEPLRHRNGVRRVSISRDGRHIVTCSNDGTARVWRTDNYELISPPLPHSGIVTVATLAADGRRLLTGGNDGTLKLWDLPTDSHAYPTLRHEGNVNRAEFSHDGTHVLTTSNDHMARWWNLETGAAVSLVHGGMVLDCKFTASGDRFATGGVDGIVRIGDGRTGQWLPLQMNHEAVIFGVAFSPSGGQLVSCGRSRWAKVWNATTGELVASLAHRDFVHHASFSFNGKLIATSGADGMLRLWDADLGSEARPALDLKTPLWTCVFSPDSRSVAVRGDKSATVWNLETGKTIELRHPESMSGLSFSADGRWIVTGCSDGMVTVWDAVSGRQALPRMPHGTGQVFATRFSPDNNLLATAGGSRELALLPTIGQRGGGRVWDVATGTPISPLLDHRGMVPVIAFSPDGQRVVTGGDDGRAKVWKLEPDNRPIDDLKSLAELLAGRRVNDVNGLVALSPAELRSRWEVLRPKYPASFASSSAAISAWEEPFPNKVSDPAP